MCNYLPVRKRFTLAAAAFLILCGSALAQIGHLPAVQLPQAAQNIAVRILQYMPDFKGAVVAGTTPVYAPRSQRIVYYEIKLISPNGMPMGYLLLTPDGAIAEMRSKGLAKSDELARKTQVRPFKMIRFTPHFVTAEDSSGRVVAEIGTRPRVFTDQFLAGLQGSPSQAISSFQPVSILKGDASYYRQYASFDTAYADFAANYDKLFLKTLPPPQQQGTSSVAIPGVQYVEAIGHSFTSRMKQLHPGDPLNDKSWASGCGPTAVFNMLAWHDGNWVPSLLTGSPVAGTGEYTEVGKANYTKMLRDVMGTWGTPSNEGATFPWDMIHGLMHKETNGGYKVEKYSAWRLPSDMTAYTHVRNAIRDLGKPAIVGYWSDVHYDLVYKYVDMWGSLMFYADLDSEDGVWINPGDLFYVAVVYNYEPKGSLINNGSFEAGNYEWAGGGSRGITLRNTSSHQGLAHGWIGSSNGASGNLTRFFPYQANAISYNAEAWVKAPAGAKVWMKVLNSDMSVHRSVNAPAGLGMWTKIQLTGIAQSSSFRMLTIMVEAGAGNNVTLVDSVRIVPVMPTGGSGTQPCIPNKPGGGLDEGCDFP